MGFYLATTTLSGRDVVEEALAAKVMPLSRGWAPLRMEKKTFPGCMKELPYPRFDLVQPTDRSDEALIAELEHEAHYYLGSYSPKEVEAAKATLCHEGRINHPFHEMGISIDPRNRPSKGAKRFREPGNVGSDAPKPKKKREQTGGKVKTRKLEKIKQSVHAPKVPKKTHIYKAYDEDLVFLDSQLSSDKPLSASSSSPAPIFVTPISSLPPVGSGSGLSTEDKAAEAATSLIDLSAVGAHEPASEPPCKTPVEEAATEVHSSPSKPTPPADGSASPRPQPSAVPDTSARERTYFAFFLFD